MPTALRSSTPVGSVEILSAIAGRTPALQIALVVLLGCVRYQAIEAKESKLKQV